MKKNIFIAIIALSVSACGINRQVDNLKAFEKCKYEVTAADSVYVGNMDVSQIVNKGGFDPGKMPGIVFAMLRKDVPLRARLKLKIQNPSNAEAAINQFEYKLLHKSIELASGYVNEKVRVEPNGGVTTVPIDIHSNIYHILADPKAQQAFVDFISDDGNPEKKAVLTIKIRPTLDIGNKQIKYPGYITIDKEITNKILF